MSRVPTWRFSSPPDPRFRPRTDSQGLGVPADAEASTKGNSPAESRASCLVQLAAVYRRQGHDEAARDLLLAKQRRRRSGRQLGARLWGYVQDWTVGYGYRPFRAALWLAALLLIGTVVFTAHQPPAFKRGEAPPFNAFLYSLDLLLPIISFGQESAFGPRGAQQWLAAGMITAGWILATTILAGLTRALSRQ